jgi:ectoine hydroxylase-related dioxygenase (phytanoyl-CoA dioxygenase family)
MTQAAEQASANGSKILQEESGSKAMGRYLTEIDGGRWHKELRRFEHAGPLGEICAQLLNSRKMNFFMDHCFLKEPGSKIRTAFHQDAPYFPFVGEQIAVCWCPVDSVSFESGAMGYIKGSHKWAEYSPNLLVSREKTHDNSTPMLPDIEGNEDEYDIVYFDAEPGDVIIHHPRTVHGSRGNV